MKTVKINCYQERWYDVRGGALPEYVLTETYEVKGNLVELKTLYEKDETSFWRLIRELTKGKCQYGFFRPSTVMFR